jgi:CubicO group peptidase (beta-lactamase class C family)
MSSAFLSAPRLLAVLILILQMVFIAPAFAEGAPQAYYPGDEGWRTCTPEEQGVDSRLLLEMFQTVQREKVPIHSALIIRNGYLICEAYFQPFHRDTPHNLFSATKSFTSTLVGIAIGEGRISGVDAKVTDIFPDIRFYQNNMDLEKTTLEHLLTMSAGHKAESVDAVYGSRYWPQTFFELPFVTKPGEEFLYDSGASHLLSAVLTKTTGENAEDYARPRLFDPIGIRNYAWELSPEGINTGGWGLRLTPSDMARFGYLALQNGVWNGQQIVPAQWLQTATQKHIDGHWGADPADDYGYQWWINSFGGFRADGFGGQYIYVLPEYNMVAVFTAGINYSEAYQPGRLMSDFVIPASKSREPLAANPEGDAALDAYIKELDNPAPQAVAPLPSTAARISGKTIAAEGASTLKLNFPGGDTCYCDVVALEGPVTLPVGLDGVYRVTTGVHLGQLTVYPPYPGVALRGHWEGENVFVVDFQYVGEPYHEEYRFTFGEKDVLWEVKEYVIGSATPMMEYIKLNGILQE